MVYEENEEGHQIPKLKLEDDLLSNLRLLNGVCKIMHTNSE